MPKMISVQEAAALVQDGMTVAIGGFLGCGNAHHVIDALVEKGVKDLTIIANDSPATGYGLAKLIDNHQVKRLIASHVGLNPNVATQMNEGTLEVWLIPQGSLAEMIRAGGGGLGGVITPTGLGTLVEESPLVDSKITIDGREYLVMKPVRADVALICGYKVDPAGNVWYKGTSRNYNTVVATCADVVICEADNMVEIGDIEPENVMTQGIFVDYIVDGGKL
ncbi:MAG: CoA transferase subunit A [Oscillospiraceae bacterium]|nr:CoA transferase subunit A [Oscillospiraceae bacterium]MCD8376286.1 CoA transferase subunit A [Oscillospiraceae bacterium]